MFSPKFILCAALTLNFLGSARLAAAEAFKGFYVGAHAGYGLGSSNATTTATNPSSEYYLSDAYAPLVSQAGSTTMALSSLIGGLEGGYNAFLSKHILLGVEVDVDSFNLNCVRQTTVPYFLNAPPAAATLNQSFQTKWLVTVQPRVSFVLHRFLLYATGGLAVTQFNNHLIYSDNLHDGPTLSNAYADSSIQSVAYGWSAGLGGEFLLTTNWSIKAELSSIYFPAMTASTTLSHNPHIGGIGNPFSYTTNLQFSMIRVGLNYYFNK